MHMCTCSMVPPKNPRNQHHRLAVVGVVFRLFIIITYRCRSINIFKHDDNITSALQLSKPGSCMAQVGIEKSKAEAEEFRCLYELNNCCVRLRKANILQIKRFSDFVNVGYQFPSVHTHNTPCVHMDESASHWQCGLASLGDLHIHNSHSLALLWQY